MNPRATLKRTAAEAREMHRLYPFTKTVSSAAYGPTPPLGPNDGKKRPR